MNILAVCPANCATGGPEAIHEFTSNMNKLEDVDARIWYWNAGKGDPTPQEYKRYGCEYVTELPKGYDGVIVFPEIWANYAALYPDIVTAVWWLGVDAYASWTPADQRGEFLGDDSIIHIAQSQYAYEFLHKLRVRKLYKCGDLLNADFYEEFEEEERSDVVLYNPVKATPFMKKIMDACPDVKFKPVKDMTRAQVIDTMRHSKLYIDFGEFPGRERMPREAALCGCCLITSKVGAAAYHEDFRHNYKYDSKDAHIWAIVRRIHEVLDNFEECQHDFEIFRRSLMAERKGVQFQYRTIRGAFYEVFDNYSGA